MENKKLINILTKDMTDLEELIAEMKAKQRFDMLEAEFIHTRVKGVLHLLQLLESGGEPAVRASDERPEILEKLKAKVERVSELTAGIAPVSNDRKKEEKKEEEHPLPGVVPEPDEHDEEPSRPRKEPLPGVVPEPPKKDELSAVQVEEKNPAGHKNVEEDDGEMLHDEPVEKEKSSRLGDSFLKNKSVNDLINEQVKLEYKLSNRPVNSIQSHIGINDRFQFTRELFDGDSKKFLEAVRTLDSMDNIKEAVDYLRANFKWKKNETSLKFVNLVKRRFLNTTA